MSPCPWCGRLCGSPLLSTCSIHTLQQHVHAHDVPWRTQHQLATWRKSHNLIAWLHLQHLFEFLLWKYTCVESWRPFFAGGSHPKTGSHTELSNDIWTIYKRPTTFPTSMVSPRTRQRPAQEDVSKEGPCQTSYGRKKAICTHCRIQWIEWWCHNQSEEIHSLHRFATCDLFPTEQETTSGHCSHDASRAASLRQCVQLFVHTTETNTLLIFWRPSQPATGVGQFCWLSLQLGGLQVSWYHGEREVVAIFVVTCDFLLGAHRLSSFFIQVLSCGFFCVNKSPVVRSFCHRNTSSLHHVGGICGTILTHQYGKKDSATDSAAGTQMKNPEKGKDVYRRKGHRGTQWDVRTISRKMMWYGKYEGIQL